MSQAHCLNIHHVKGSDTLVVDALQPVLCESLLFLIVYKQDPGAEVEGCLQVVYSILRICLNCFIMVAVGTPV